MVSIRIGQVLLRVSRQPCIDVNTVISRPISSVPGKLHMPWSNDTTNISHGSPYLGCNKYRQSSPTFCTVHLNNIVHCATSSKKSFHTLRPYVPAMSSYDACRQFLLYNSRSSSGGSTQIWSEDIACILQGTCLPGSTKYCRTSNMFGAMTLSDVAQGTTVRYSSTDVPEAGQVSLTQRQRLKLAVRDYGSTVIVFHVCISLMSLGGFYLAVSSGLDVQGLLKMLHFGEDIISSKLAAGASTFVVAYAVHKLFAPVRIAITLTCTPFIVRYLRSVGVLKMKNVPKPPS